MKGEDLSHARVPDLRASQAALLRASELARKTAIQTNTHLVIVQDGRIVRIPPETLREQAKERQQLTPAPEGG